MGRFLRYIRDWYLSGFAEVGRMMETGVKVF